MGQLVQKFKWGTDKQMDIKPHAQHCNPMSLPFMNNKHAEKQTFQITNLMHNSFFLQQYVCYTTILNMFRTARCLKHVEDHSVTYILLKKKEIVH